IEITDNGCGISQDNLNRINSMIYCDQEEEPNLEADSIGILNISKRLKLFSSYSDIQYKSKEKYYTSVRLVIPTGES
ncbi:MAG TPA: ATPase, partial [Ruminiclostridium sp.]|nr:ATPase [Ruminiclostridium sp.]